MSKKQATWKALLERLETRCLQPIDEFRKLGTVTETKNGPLIHIDRGSKILGVAHLDTVAREWPTAVKWTKTPGCVLPTINSIQLDDRLGVWVLLDVLPACGLVFDVLLCDSEERGASTAEHFTTDRDYNWGFEFDRAGVDTVLYDYEDSDEWTKSLEEYGFDIRRGSFSDISSLTHLGVCFANFGVGYHHQHTHNCYAHLDDTVFMARQFVDFFKGEKDKRYEYEQRTWSRRNWWDWSKKDSWKVVDKSGAAWKQDDDLPDVCPWCSSADWDDDAVCKVCGYDALMDDYDEPDRECKWCGSSDFEVDGYWATCKDCGFVERD